MDHVLLCPRCGASSVVPVYRGYLPFELARAVAEGRALYDGFLGEGEPVDWACLGCSWRW